MDAIFPAINAVLSSPALAAYGPTVPILLVMAFILWSHLRGAAERLARANEEYQKALREDQRELFEEQARQLDAERATNASLDARARALDALSIRQRRAIFDLYVIARENAHLANNAIQLIPTAIREQTKLASPVWPELPKAD